jgi:hypothetical protein
LSLAPDNIAPFITNRRRTQGKGHYRQATCVQTPSKLQKPPRDLQSPKRREIVRRAKHNPRSVPRSKAAEAQSLCCSITNQPSTVHTAEGPFRREPCFRLDIDAFACDWTMGRVLMPLGTHDGIGTNRMGDLQRYVARFDESSRCSYATSRLEPTSQTTQPSYYYLLDIVCCRSSATIRR